MAIFYRENYTPPGVYQSVESVNTNHPHSLSRLLLQTSRLKPKEGPSPYAVGEGGAFEIGHTHFRCLSAVYVYDLSSRD